MKIKFSILLFLISHVVHAQWEQLLMPAGGDIQFLGTMHNRVWAECSGANFFTDDGGANWQRWALEDTLEYIKLWLDDENIIAVASRKNAVNSNINEKRIFRSQDNGNTWELLFHDTQSQYKISSAFMAGDNLFFVSTGSFGLKFLYRSADGGNTWQKLNAADSGTIYNRLDEAYSDGNTLVIGIWIEDGIGDPYYYRFRSTDFGDTWQMLGFINPNTSEYYFCFADGCMVLRRYNQPSSPLNISYDAGQTFVQIPQDACKSNFFYTPASGLLAYDYDCVSKFDASSNIWNNLTIPPVGFSYLVSIDNGDLVAGIHQGGAWRKPAATSSWEEANNGLSNNNVWDLETHHGVYYLYNYFPQSTLAKTNADFQLWAPVALPYKNTTDILTWGDTLLLVTDSLLYFSKNDGATWDYFSSPSLSQYPKFRNVKCSGDALIAVFNNPDSPDILYTPDRGATWKVLSRPGVLSWIDDVYHYQGKIWVTGSGSNPHESLCRSDDLGAQWSAVPIQDVYTRIAGIQDHICLLDNQTSFSPDGGATIQPVAGLDPGHPLLLIKAGKGGRLYGLAYEKGVYTSDDFGATWSFFDNPGYPDLVNIFPVENILYASRVSTGLWKRAVSTATQTPDAAVIALHVSPNPASTMLRIVWTGDSQSIPAHLSILDQTGRIRYQQNHFTGQEEIDVRPWPAGVYFIRSGDLVQKWIKD